VTGRYVRRLPAHRSVEAALDYCERMGYGPPVLHQCDSQLIVGYVDATPQPPHAIVRELEIVGVLGGGHG
jgi:hypothetical protein